MLNFLNSPRQMTVVCDGFVTVLQPLRPAEVAAWLVGTSAATDPSGFATTNDKPMPMPEISASLREYDALVAFVGPLSWWCPPILELLPTEYACTVVNIAPSRRRKTVSDGSQDAILVVAVEAIIVAIFPDLSASPQNRVCQSVTCDANNFSRLSAVGSQRR